MLARRLLQRYKQGMENNTNETASKCSESCECMGKGHPVRRFRPAVTTKLILRADLKPGDTFWFSGYWCTFVRWGADGRGYGRFPYTPADKEVWLFHAELPESEYIKKYGAHQVTIKVTTQG